MLKINYGFTETSFADDQPIDVTDFSADDRHHQGFVIGYRQAIPPFVRVIFTSPLRPDHIVKYEGTDFPDVQTPGVIASLINEAVGLKPVEQ